MNFNAIASRINSLNEHAFLDFLTGKFRTIGTLDQRVVRHLNPRHCAYLINAQPWWISCLSTNQVHQMIVADKINSTTFIHISMPQLDLMLQERYQFSRSSWSLLRGFYMNLTTKQFIIFWNDCNNLLHAKPFLLEYVSNQRIYELFRLGGHILMKMCEEPSASHFGITARLANMISNWNKDEWYEEWFYLQKMNHLFWLQQQMIIHGNIVSINTIDFQRWHFTHMIMTFEKIVDINKVVEIARSMEPRFLRDLLLNAPVNNLLQLIVSGIPINTPLTPFDPFWNYLYLNIDKTPYNQNLAHYAYQSGDPTKIEIISLHLPKKIGEESTVKLD